tara:strand:- start:16 stop:390 length:375 start_codon:yes stop_codon:yes gene_type:complete
MSKSALELESTIVRLEEAIAANNTDTRCFEADLKIAKRKLEDINKPELTPLQFDLIQEAIEKGVEEYDFSDTSNFDIEYGIEYDNKIYCESHELSDSGDLCAMIIERVHKLFTEAECPEEEISE